MKQSELDSAGLNRLIHEKIFGWQEKSCVGPERGMIIREHLDLWQCGLCGYLGHGDESNYPHNEHEDIPPYSTDMNAAWLIVEKLYTQFHVEMEISQSGSEKYTFLLYDLDQYVIVYESSSNESMSIAICLVALRGD